MRNTASWLAATVALAMTAPASALRFNIGDVDGSLAMLFTVGAQWRMEDPADDLRGKSNLNPDLCASDTRCLGFEDGPMTAEQREHLNAPGIFSLNYDDANFNYEKGDLTAAAFKLTPDLSLVWGDYGLFARGYFLFDPVNVDFVEFHPNRAVGPEPEDRAPRHTRRSGELRRLVGAEAEIMDLYLFGVAPLGENYEVAFRIGDQLINWGESTFLVVNSLNTINPPAEGRLFVPSVDFKEVLMPVGAVYGSVLLTDRVAVDAFYNYEWEPVMTTAPGTFFSISDIGVPGGRFASLPYGSNAEDPEQLERVPGPNNVVQDLDLTRTSLTILRERDRRARDSGQYGLMVKWYAEKLGNTELGFYYMNYHSRLPLASSTAAYRSCLRPEDPNQAPTGADFLACNRATNPALAGMSKQERYERGLDLQPADSVDLFLEYPEDIRLIGISFNTNVGDIALQGEYAFRPNLPVQVDTEDMVNAALHPAFPRENVNPASLTGLPLPDAFIVAGEDVAVEDLIESRYRGNSNIEPRQYIRGYERLAVGQLSTSATYVLGPGNWLGADQWIMLAEVGFNNIFDLPSRSEAVFEGPGTDTHALPGRRELNNQLVQNPEQQHSGFVTDFSWGYRLYSIASYKNVIRGIALEPQVIFFHDVDGVGPGPGANFVEGRMDTNLALNVVIDQFKGTIGYGIFSGGGEHNLRRDRDYASLSVRYEF